VPSGCLPSVIINSKINLPCPSWFDFDERLLAQCGFWRPYVEQVICLYLDCDDLHNDFAR
jgi:hypothetical protein